MNASKVDEPLPLINAAFPNQIGFARGFERLDKENQALTDEAVALAKKAEAVWG